MQSPNKSMFFLMVFGSVVILIVPFLRYLTGNTQTFQVKTYLIVIFIETLILNLLRYKIQDRIIKKIYPIFLIIVLITFFLLR